MNEKPPVPDKEGAVRIRDGKVEVFDGEQWGPYRAVPAPPGVRVQCRCMNHSKKED
jgi:hypothetical protein